MNKDLEIIDQYNRKAGYTKDSLKALVENGDGLELLVLSYSTKREFTPRLGVEHQGIPFDSIPSFVVGRFDVCRRATRNRSYGENEVLLYLFDIYGVSNQEGKASKIYLGTFVVRHGIVSDTYFALKAHEAKHNLESAKNSANFLNGSDLVSLWQEKRSSASK